MGGVWEGAMLLPSMGLGLAPRKFFFINLIANIVKLKVEQIVAPRAGNFFFIFSGGKGGNSRLGDVWRKHCLWVINESPVER